MGKIITVTAGHSSSDPGAVNGTHIEANIAADMRNMVALYLKQADIEVRTDGEGQRNLSLNHAITLIKGSAVAVEFHCNASHDKRANGVEALSQTKDKVISQELCRAVTIESGFKVRGERGWKPENSGQHSRLGYVRSGGIILELFFISNEEELKVWYAKKWLIAKSVAGVLIEVARG